MSFRRMRVGRNATLAVLGINVCLAVSA